MADPLDAYDVFVNLQAGDKGAFAAYLKAVTEHINKLTPETEKWGKEFSRVAGKAGQLFDDFKSGAIVVNTFTAAFRGFNDILKNMEAISVSAGMTKNQFDELTTGITQGAAETGKSFGAVAESARAIFEQTGLKEGLGDVVLDSERLSRTFGISETTVGKLTVQMIQFGEGTITAHDVMKAFDKTTGITGSKLEQMVEHITDMGKTMRNIVGGGDKFSKAMKDITGFTTRVAAKFQEMGGDTDAFKEIQTAILDPSKWSEISRKLPGMAGNLYEMQEAMTGGNMDRFGELLKEGAQRTVEMGKGMNAFTRSAAGFDLTTAEIFSKMDFSAIKAAGESSGGVMDRMGRQLRDLGKQWDTFVNNFLAALMPVLGWLMEGLSSILSAVNAFFSSIQGSWLSFFAWATMALLTGFVIFKMIFTKVFVYVAEQLSEVGSATGKALGKTVASFADQIAVAAPAMLKASLALLAIGGALLLLAAAVWIMSDAVTKEGFAIGIITLVAGLGILVLALWGLGAAAVTLAPGILVMYAIGGAVLFLAGAFWIFSKGIENIVNSVIKLGDVSDTLGKLGETIKKISAMDFSTLNAAGTAIGGFFKSLFSFGGGEAVTIDPKVVESVKSVITIVENLSKSIIAILTTGDMISANKQAFDQIFIDLFDKDEGILIKMVKNIDAGLQSGWFSTTISKDVQESISFLIDIMTKFKNGMIDILVLGEMTKDATVVGGFNDAIYGIFGPGGFVQTLSTYGGDISKDFGKMKDATEMISGMGKMVDPLIQMMVMGEVLGGGGMANLLRFADGMGAFTIRLSQIGKYVDKDSFDNLAKMPALIESLDRAFSTTISINAKGGAEVALEDHDKITREHQQNVEQLLTEIRDGVKTFSASTTPQNTTTKGNEPAWRPEAMFTEVSEVF